MPSQKLLRRQVVPALRFDERVAVLRKQCLFGAFAARHLLAEHQLVGVGEDGKSAQIEDLVVQGT